jgi:hypothetical protein
VALNADGDLACPDGAEGMDPFEPISIVDVLGLIGGEFAYLLIMAYILEAILKKAPEIAAHLSQAPFAPRLGESIEHRFSNLGNGFANGIRDALSK